MPQPATLPLTLYEGDTFTYPFRIRVQGGAYVDLTGHTVKCQIRKSNGTLVLEVTCTIHPDQGANPGLVTLSLTKVETTGLTAAAGTGALSDVEITNPAGDRRTYIKFAPITITAEITKDA